jgi:hypothetical protein
VLNLLSKPNRQKEPEMTSENFISVLDMLVKRNPYHPFTVELHGGNRFEIDYPQALSYRDGNAVFFAPGGVPIWFDHESVLQIIGAEATRRV